MKKSLSFVLAVIMALSAFLGINFSVFASDDDIKNVEINILKPLTVREEIDGYYFEDEYGKLYFDYNVTFNIGDEIIVTKNDGTEISYKYWRDPDSDDSLLNGDFFDENGERLWYSTFGDQYENHWGVGIHSYNMYIYNSYELKVPVEVLPRENADLSDVPVVIDNINVREYTEGQWVSFEGEKPFYVYDIYEIFSKYGKITFNREDGTTSEFYNRNSDDIGSLSDDKGNVIKLINYSYDDDWKRGSHVLKIYISENDRPLRGDYFLKINIVKATCSDCANSGEWIEKNGMLEKTCASCGLVAKLPFYDISNCKYYGDYIAYTSLYNEFLNGTNPPVHTVFSPTRAIDRAMMVTILYRMAGEPYANGKNPYASSPFTDITNTSVYYYDAACWALKNGITTETTFKPFNAVTREQTATFLYRYAQDNGKLGNEDYKNVNLDAYHDGNRISHFAIDAMKWANYNGMITGTEQGYANPQGATQRIHATKILYGFGKTCNIGNFE